MTTHDGLPARAKTALEGLRVLDLAEGTADLCARLLGDLGADVVKVEPPEGDFLRHRGPYAHNITHEERGLAWLVFNTNKRSITLDFLDPSHRAFVQRLASQADVLVESAPPEHLASLGLGYAELAQENPGLVYVSITPFGQSGPYSQYKGTELIAQAMGGLLAAQGDERLPPCMAPLDLVTQVASMHATTGALLALRARHATGRGQRVDVSLQETAVQLNDMALARHSMFGETGRRTGSRPLWPACNIYPTQDGWVFLAPFTAEQAHRLEVEWMAHPILREPTWCADSFRRQNMDAIDRWATEFTHGFSTQEFVEEAQRRGIPAAPLATVPQAVTFLREAGAFVETSHLTVGPYPIPEMPFRLHTTPTVIRRPAPLLGQHTEEIALGGWGEEKQQPGDGGVRTSSNGPPLAGVRVLDFGRLLAGPLTTLALAAFGAEVIKIESADLSRFDDPSYPDFPEANRSKLSLSLDVRQPQGRELALRLARLSDVVVENFRPGVMERLGLGYDNFRQMKPNIIMASLPGMDPQAPQRDWGVYGQQVTALTGLTCLWGHPGSPLSTHPKIPVSDVLVAAEAALAVLAALEHKTRTGEGQLIEVPQLVAMANLLAVPYLDYLLNEWETLPRGNGSPTMAPHGVYRCRGEDAWCAIAVTAEQEWRRFVEALGSPEWALDGTFATVKSRLRLRDELDRHVEEWTSQRTPSEVMRLLQEASVPAGAVLDGKGLAEDPHLRQRGFIVGVKHLGWGYVEHAGAPALLSETPGKAEGPVHSLGQDNDYVLRELLGLSAKKVEQLVHRGIVR